MNYADFLNRVLDCIFIIYLKVFYEKSHHNYMPAAINSKHL